MNELMLFPLQDYSLIFELLSVATLYRYYMTLYVCLNKNATFWVIIAGNFEI